MVWRFTTWTSDPIGNVSVVGPRMVTTLGLLLVRYTVTGALAVEPAGKVTFNSTVSPEGIVGFATASENAAGGLTMTPTSSALSA